MTNAQNEQILKTAQEWKEYQAHEKFMKNNKLMWSPVMSDRQKKEHDEYVIENNLPF